MPKCVVSAEKPDAEEDEEEEDELLDEDDDEDEENEDEEDEDEEDEDDDAAAAFFDLPAAAAAAATSSPRRQNWILPRRSLLSNVRPCSAATKASSLLGAPPAPPSTISSKRPVRGPPPLSRDETDVMRLPTQWRSTSRRAASTSGSSGIFELSLSVAQSVSRR